MNSPVALAIADLNGDGNSDVGVAAYGSNTIQIFFGQGNGIFSSPTNITGSGLAGVYSTIFTDFNRDGFADILSTTYTNPPGVISIYTNNKSGAFSLTASYASTRFDPSSRTADLNGDTYPDVVTPGDNYQLIYTYMGTAAGLLNNPNTIQPVGNATIGDVALGDLNSDGRIDLVAVDHANGYIWWTLGKGDGSFGVWSSASYGTAGSSCSLNASDIDGDGNLDVVVGSPSQAKIAVFFGTGAGTFQVVQNVSVSSGQVSAAVAEVTGDSFQDLVALTYSNPANVIVVPGAGGRTWQTPINYVLGAPSTTTMAPQAVAVADINGDGRADVLAASVTANLVGVYLGGSATLTTPVAMAVAAPAASYMVKGDWNGDGNLDVVISSSGNSAYFLPGNGSGGFGAAQAISSGSPWGVAAGDLNADGKLDLVSSGYPTYSGVRISMGNGNGTFMAAIAYAGGGQSILPVVGDINGDGIPDLRDPLKNCV